MIQQIEITLRPKPYGFHLVTGEILGQLPKLPTTGLVNIFTKHTSCGLSINENCDPDVRVDMETIGGRLNLGTWQGIYLCEFRNYGGARKLVVTIVGE